MFVHDGASQEIDTEQCARGDATDSRLLGFVLYPRL